MKRILGLLFLLSGCYDRTDSGPATHLYALPQELKDCKIFYLYNDGGGRLTVIKCPDGSTSVSRNCGKGCVEHTETL